ncbi:phage head-tail connector protein [Limnobacter litoralis]|uniref:Phage gp6-like head-tail connector protein n=1 Tax=Limnobacter litoralis TaxID=481366 RepID=A0ABQ5YRV9_9BURK|nr:phage head-tail connector protein [Limnobacter litoralis]GLR26515.1 hypothetical protein GCM10007875_16050 [Limnobacter litoralis]
MASGDLTTLADVRAFLGISGEADDQLITRMITEHSQAIQNYVNRQLTSQDYAETLDGYGGFTLLLRNYPITAISSLSVNGRTIPAAAGYSDPGYRFRNYEVVLNGYRFDRGLMNVEIAYTAGFETVPSDLAGACIKWVASSYRERERLGQASKQLNGAETVSYIVKDMPDSVKTVLKQYMRVVPL